MDDTHSRKFLISERTRQWINDHISKRYHRLRGKFAGQLARNFPSVSKQLHAARYHNAERRIVGLIDRPRPIRPDFIIIGSPKCGTSWLRDVLDEHPKVITARGEIEYFSSHSYYPIEWYFEQLARRFTSTKKKDNMTSLTLGEKSAHYCSMPLEQIQRVRDLLPDVRLILMTRDPVVRHWAHAKRYFAKSQLHNPETAVLDVPRSKLIEFFERERTVGEYSKIVANWTAVFPDRQLIVVSQEKTFMAPRTTFDAVLRHIGVSTDYEPALIPLLNEKTNQGPKVEMPEDVAEFLENLFASERRWLREFFGDRSAASVP